MIVLSQLTAFPEDVSCSFCKASAYRPCVVRVVRGTLRILSRAGKPTGTIHSARKKASRALTSTRMRAWRGLDPRQRTLIVDAIRDNPAPGPAVCEVCDEEYNGAYVSHRPDCLAGLDIDEMLEVVAEA